MNIEEIIQQFKQSTFYMQNYSLKIYSKVSSIIKINNNAMHVILDNGNLEVYLDRIVKMDEIPFLATKFDYVYQIKNYNGSETLGYIAR